MKNYKLGVIGHGYVGESQSFAFSPSFEVKVYDKESLKSVMLFQEYSGLDSDGVVGKKTYQALNLSIDTKLLQVLVNLERLRWLNFNFGKDYILINQ